MRRILSLMPLLISMTIAFCSPVFASATKITLVAGHPPVLRWVAHLSETFMPAVDHALEGSDERIEWDGQFGGGLAKVGQSLETTAEGIADIGLVLSVFDPSKLPIQNVSYYTPFSTVSTPAIMQVMADLHANSDAFGATWTANGLVYLGGGVGTTDYFLMTKQPVANLDDLMGLKLGVAGPGVNWLSGTKAVGVSGNLTTYYTNIKSGVLDGAVVPGSAAAPTKLYEVAPHILKIGFGAQYAGGLAANADWFARQSPAMQQALRKGAHAYSEAYTQELDVLLAEALVQMKAAGATITDADAALRQAWVDGMANIATDWQTTLGPDSSVVADYMNALRAAGENPLRDWDRD